MLFRECADHRGAHRRPCRLARAPPARRHGDDSRAASTNGRRLPRGLRRVSDEDAQGRPTRARRPLQRLLREPVRIAFDVSPLSHPRTGIGNYVQGSLAGLAEAAGGAARADRLRADEAPRPPPDPRGARRRAGRAAHRRAPVLARLPNGVEPSRTPVRRAIPRPLRRAPLQRLARAAPARRDPLDDGARPRPAALSRVGDAPDALDARLQVRTDGGVRSRLRQLGLYGARRGRAARRAPGADSRRAARRLRRLHGRGGARGARPPLRPQPRDARAAQEPRDAARGLAAARRRSSPSRSPAPPAGGNSRCSTTRAS